MTKQERMYARAQSGVSDISGNEQPRTAQAPLEGQISLADILANVDDGSYGKPADENEVHS